MKLLFSTAQIQAPEAALRTTKSERGIEVGKFSHTSSSLSRGLISTRGDLTGILFFKFYLKMRQICRDPKDTAPVSTFGTQLEPPPQVKCDFFRQSVNRTTCEIVWKKKSYPKHTLFRMSWVFLTSTQKIFSFPNICISLKYFQRKVHIFEKDEKKLWKISHLSVGLFFVPLPRGWRIRG